MQTSLPLALAFGHPSLLSQLLWASAWVPAEHCSPMPPHLHTNLWVLFTCIHSSLSHEPHYIRISCSGTHRKSSVVVLDLCQLHLLF